MSSGAVVVVVEFEHVHLDVVSLAGLHRREPDPLELVSVKGGFVVGVRQLLAAVEEGARERAVAVDPFVLVDVADGDPLEVRREARSLTCVVGRPSEG